MSAFKGQTKSNKVKTIADPTQGRNAVGGSGAIVGGGSVTAVNPPVAARCLLKGDVQVNARTRRNVMAQLAARLTAPRPRAAKIEIEKKGDKL